MKLLTAVLLAALIASCAGVERELRGRVRKRNTPHRRHRDALPLCPFNATVVEDTETLLRTIAASKYIFTGKVLNVKKIGSNGRRSYLYKVHVRRVLKGELSELSERVHFEAKSSRRFTGATVFVEREKGPERCAPAPRVRYSAIFLGERGREQERERERREYEEEAGDAGEERSLRLLVDPVPLTLYHLDRLNAAVKGER